MDAFEIYQNIFKILEKAKIQVIYYEKYIEDKIARETKELKNQQIELENKLQRLEREEKRIQVELDSRLFCTDKAIYRKIGLQNTPEEFYRRGSCAAFRGNSAGIYGETV